MIICQCNTITSQEFENAAVKLLSDDPNLKITPGRVIRALKARRRCRGCLPALKAVIEDCKKQCGRENCPRPNESCPRKTIP